jgi:hypothetical protein
MFSFTPAGVDLLGILPRLKPGDSSYYADWSSI